MNRSIPWATHLSAMNNFLYSLSRLVSAMGLVIASLSLSFAAHAQSASTIEGNFTNDKSAPDWTISGSRYGSPRLPTTDGSGWLHLAGGNSDILGQVEANAKLAAGVPIRVEFDYLVWGGTFDGLTVYFADAGTASAGKGGEVGGGLGYCGMNGAFLGIGIDDGGNFAQMHCGIGRFGLPGPQQGTAASGPGVRGNSVTVRGPQSAMYPYVTSASMNDLQNICVTCTDRSQATKAIRHVVLVMEPRTPTNSGYTLSVTVDGREVLKNVDYPYAPPKELLMGLASTTGAYGANHEVRNLKLSVQGVVTATNCLKGVGADGKCQALDNMMKDWRIAMVSRIGQVDIPPGVLTDGNLAQAGWDGTMPWTGQFSALDGGCMNIAASSSGSGSLANQIMVVSRQDDWQNAVEPTENTTFTKYGAVDFDVIYRTLDQPGIWKNVSGGPQDVVGNNKVMRIWNLPKTETLVAVTLTICRTGDDNTSPLTEFLIWEKK